MVKKEHPAFIAAVLFHEAVHSLQDFKKLNSEQREFKARFKTKIWAGLKANSTKVSKEERAGFLKAYNKSTKDADFEEADHPRAESGEHGGEFVKAGTGGGSVSTEEKKVKPTELTHEDLDEKAKQKYERISSLQKQFNTVWKENAAVANKDERAACLSLIMKTGIRPGSDKDMHSKVKAYGATTLEGRHIIEENGDVFLRYVGKKGVNLDIPIPDKDIAKMLLDRKKKVGDSGRVFDTNAEKVLDHSHSLDGGEFKTKDFRTYVGTSTAIALVKKESPPTNFKEYKKKVMDIAKRVSQRLGNTPVVALQSYVDPRVFSEWRKGISV
jgi:hypothetical protein